MKPQAYSSVDFKQRYGQSNYTQLVIITHPNSPCAATYVCPQTFNVCALELSYNWSREWIHSIDKCIVLHYICSMHKSMRNCMRKFVISFRYHPKRKFLSSYLTVLQIKYSFFLSLFIYLFFIYFSLSPSLSLSCSLNMQVVNPRQQHLKDNQMKSLEHPYRYPSSPYKCNTNGFYGVQSNILKKWTGSGTSQGGAQLRNRNYFRIPEKLLVISVGKNEEWWWITSV